MKKKIFTASLLVLTVVASAQLAPPVQQQTPGGMSTQSSAPTTTGFKPSQGDFTFEMNLNPFKDSTISINYLRFRYFVGDQLAIRAGFALGVVNNSPNKSFELAVLPGIEKHFEGTERLSPYVGAEISIASKSSSYFEADGNNSKSIKGSYGDGSNQGFFRLGVNGVIGCDFYFSKHIYAGLEAGYGFVSHKTSDIDETNVTDGISRVEPTQKGHSSFELGFNFNSAIRVGFAF